MIKSTSCSAAVANLLLQIQMATCAMGAEFIPLGGFPERGSSSLANAISADGTTVVGGGSGLPGTFPGQDAFLWKEPTGLVNLQTGPILFTQRIFAGSVSADGSVVVGTIVIDGGTDSVEATPGVSFEPFRWTDAEGIVGLGHLPGGQAGVGFANDVSADGLTIVGGSSSGNSRFEAFHWTADTGMVGLGDLPGEIFLVTPQPFPRMAR